jgi:hypothetical protein
MHFSPSPFVRPYKPPQSLAASLTDKTSPPLSFAEEGGGQNKKAHFQKPSGLHNNPMQPFGGREYNGTIFWKEL